MKVVSVSKTVKKKHKSRKKSKRRKFNKILTKKLITTFELNQSQFFEMTGNCFWSNYFKAFEWRDGYINFWSSLKNNQIQSPNIIVSTEHKSRKKIRKARARDCTNDVQECIRDLNCITLDSNGESSSSMSRNISSLSVNEEDNCSENDFEVSEEMIHFMEINMRHRADLEREKERLRQLREEMETKEEISERDNIEECQVPREAANNQSRIKEMSNLYGKSAPMIHGMETAIQLTFNWNCDHHKPEYWPILPFNFKFPSK